MDPGYIILDRGSLYNNLGSIIADRNGLRGIYLYARCSFTTCGTVDARSTE